MFQVEINHFLQSFQSGLLDAYMQFISLFGYQWVIILLLIIFIYGIDFRKGFILGVVVGWTSLFIGLFKDFFALPRPFDVDSSLNPFGAHYTLETGRFLHRGATGFFKPLPHDVVQTLHSSGLSDYGFPSGHCALAVSFWGGIALLFRKKWVQWLSAIIILSTPFSRLYLARHFLADTLGGLLLGFLVLFIIYIIAMRPRYTFLSDLSYLSPSLKTVLIRTGLLIVLPLLMLFFPMVGPRAVAYMMGFNSAFLLLCLHGYPVSKAPLLIRAGRVALLSVLFFGVGYLSSLLPQGMGSLIMFFRDFMVMFVPFTLGTWLCQWLGWFSKNPSGQVA
jgi:membrane-associated phospholipid phosphatase